MRGVASELTIEQISKEQIDDVRIYNRALSPTEVQALYHLGTVILRPN